MRWGNTEAALKWKKTLHISKEIFEVDIVTLFRYVVKSWGLSNEWHDLPGGKLLTIFLHRWGEVRDWCPPILLLRTLLVNTGKSTFSFSLIPVHAGLDIELLLIVIPAVSLCKVCGWQMYEHLPEPTPRCSVNLYKICLKWDQIWRLQLFPLFTSNDCGTFPSETFPAHFCLCNCKNICKIVKKM